jgi:1-acyl-sn-glycerol-3-phosphate acyltransferase
MYVSGQIAGELSATQTTDQAWPMPRLHNAKAAGLAPSENAHHRKVVLSRKAALSRRALYEIGHSLMSAYTTLMLDMDIRWHAPMPNGPKILAPNHPTTTDPLYLVALLPEPVSFLITAALFTLPVVGGYLRAAGHVPAVRGSGGATVDAMVRQVEAGRSVAIFPEGALSPLAGGFHRPHSGAARVALRTGAPVIPIGIGLQRERIRVAEATVDGEKSVGHFYTSGPYAITVGRPLTFTGDVGDHERVRAVSDQIMHQIQDLARESDRRIQAVRGILADALPDPSWHAGVAGVPVPGRDVP